MQTDINEGPKKEVRGFSLFLLIICSLFLLFISATGIWTIATVLLGKQYTGNGIGALLLGMGGFIAFQAAFVLLCLSSLIFKRVRLWWTVPIVLIQIAGLIVQFLHLTANKEFRFESTITAYRMRNLPFILTESTISNRDTALEFALAQPELQSQIQRLDELWTGGSWGASAHQSDDGESWRVAFRTNNLIPHCRCVIHFDKHGKLLAPLPQCDCHSAK